MGIQTLWRNGSVEDRMKQYQCFISRFAGDLSDPVLIEAEDHVHACLAAAAYLKSHAHLTAVELFDGNQSVIRLPAGSFATH